MDSGNSGSMQSSSGGDEEYDSRAESISAFLNPPGHVGSLSNQAHPHQQPHHQTHTMFDPLSNYFDPSSSTARSVQNPLSNPNSLLNFDMVWSKTPRSDPNPTDLGGLITPSSSAPSQPFLTNQLGGQQTRAPTFHNIQIPPQADQQQNASRASLSSTSANDQAQPSNNNMVRNPKKRSRASRRAPTTVLTTDTTNFRAMVQEFTGIPAPPFTSSPFPRSRLDLFGTSSSLRSSGPTGLDPSPPPYLLRPFAQKVQPLPFVSSTSSTTSMIDALGSNPTTNATNSTYQHHNLLNMNMQSPILNFQSLLQAQPKFSLSNSPSIHSLGSKPQGGSLEIPSNDHSHLKMGTSVLEEFGLTPQQQQQQQHPHHHHQQQHHHHHHHVSTQLMSGLPNIVSSDGTTLSRTDNNNNSNNNNPPPTNWTNDTGLNGSYSNSERVTNNGKLNYSAAASASSSDFHHGDKGSENVATRSEGMVESWICSSD